MSKGQFLGELEQVVLYSIIALSENAYGVTIQQEIQRQVNRSLSFGTIYATLDRLERKGYVSSRLGEVTPERGGRPKRFFKIEAPGEIALARSRKMLETMWAAAEPNWGSATSTLSAVKLAIPCATKSRQH